MGLIEKHKLINEVAPPLDALLFGQLIDEFVSLERRYMLCDWEPAELDGGQFAEIAFRILYHADSGILNRSKGVSDCNKYLENETNTHVLQREDARSLARVVHIAWKFRSKRGAVHISPHYTANQMDARFMMESVRWSLTEMLRIFWNGDRDVVAQAIRELLDFDVPCIGRFEDVILVQRTDLSPEEEILILLHHAGEQGFSRREIGQHAMLDAPRVTKSLQRLNSSEYRQVVQVETGNYRLSSLGSKRIRDELSEKLRL